MSSCRSDQYDDDHAEGDDDEVDRQCEGADEEAYMKSLKAVVFSIVVAVRVCKMGILRGLKNVGWKLVAVRVMCL